MTFKEYIIAMASTHSAPDRGAFIGTPKDDFIADAATDDRFPTVVRDWEHLRGFLFDRRACREAVAAAELVWLDYQAELLI